jgi:hypothetical protein
MTGMGGEQQPAEIWTEARQDLFRAVGEINTHLAGVYRSALRTLETTPAPGEELARIAFACHGMREFVNRLQDVLPEEFAAEVKPKTGEMIRALPDMVAGYPDFDLSGTSSIVAVPRPLAEHLFTLTDSARREAARVATNDALIVTKSTDLGVPAIKQWKSARSYFVRVAHLAGVWDLAKNRTVPTDEETLRNILIVEDVLRIWFFGFFENRHAVDEVLDRINAPISDGVGHA